MPTKTETFRLRADGWWKLADLLVGAPEDFNSPRATFRGRTHLDGCGWLPEGEAALLRGVEDDIEFVIYSYETPIAWRVKGEWVIPEVTYSITTTRHQSLVRTAVGQILLWQDEARNA